MCFFFFFIFTFLSRLQPKLSRIFRKYCVFQKKKTIKKRLFTILGRSVLRKTVPIAIVLRTTLGQILRVAEKKNVIHSLGPSILGKTVPFVLRTALDRSE